MTPDDGGRENHTMDLGIQGRTALVTGADSGIGHATAQRLLEAGAAVVITDIDQGKLDASKADLPGDAPAVHAFAADLTDEQAVSRLAEQVQNAAGDIDILVNAAGITGPQGLFHEIDEASWMKTINTDLLAHVRITRAFLPALRRGGWGRIVFIASEDATQPYKNEIPYCAAKAGILALSKGLSHTYADDGLLVNAVSPAFIATPMTDAMMDKRAKQEGTDVNGAIRSFLAEERPGLDLKRRGAPDEVANVIAFLCSELASFVNGSNYRVDGGSVFAI